ncbi:MAG: trypsin-like peptidase domain-containing protein [Coriobacteriia bacterium]|nr:trypsin-like peptidase domain-containing protein [Coriobacteriia bacterium]
MGYDPSTGQQVPDKPSGGSTLLPVVSAAIGGGFLAAISVALLFAIFGAFGGSGDSGTPAGSAVSADFARTAAEIAAPSVVSIISGAELVDPNTGYATSSPESTGSGVIISENGYIVTNNHVVTQNDLITPQDEILVQFGARNVSARIVGRDALNDIAVIKVEMEGLNPIEIGSSDELKPGDPIVVIGNPVGIGISVSSGIVSATGRTFGQELFTGQQADDELAQLAAAIQVDAAVNHGNSGGALVNARGEFIGIPSASLGDFGTQGLNFCIPMGVAKGIIEDLIEFGRAYHPYFGANALTIDLVTADLYDLPVEQGAYIDSIDEGSPAAASGLEPTDIITVIDREDITTQLDLAGTIRSKDVGQTVTIGYWRFDSDTETWDQYETEATLGEVESIR